MSIPDDFIELDGRKIPTDSHLEKIGKIRGHGEMGQIVPEIAIIRNDDLRLTIDNVRCIVWNLQRYSSYTYISRVKDLIVPFIEGYEKHLQNSAHGEYQIRILSSLYEGVSELQKNLPILAQGVKSIYNEIKRSFDFTEYFGGRLLFEGMAGFTHLGFRYEQAPVGYYAFISRACGMAGKILDTLESTWSNPPNREDNPLRDAPAGSDYSRPLQRIIGKTGDPVPVAGVWNPCDFKSGCPNYFYMPGVPFPTINIAIKKTEYPEYWDTDSNKYEKGYAIFDYEEQSSRWELLWEDTRYRDSTIPEEEKNYLDESCNFPSELPIV